MKSVVQNRIADIIKIYKRGIVVNEFEEKQIAALMNKISELEQEMVWYKKS